MGIKEGLLALLAAKPMNGYQLKNEFEDATGNGLALNIGQIYSTLQRIERDGLIEPGVEDHEGRVVYSITPAGRAALDEWGSTPESLTDGRDEVSIKVLLSIHAGTLEPERVIDVQRSETMGMLQQYTRLRADDDGDDLAWQLHLDRLIYNAEAELRWLDRVEERLAGFDRKTKPIRSEAREEVRR